VWRKTLKKLPLVILSEQAIFSGTSFVVNIGFAKVLSKPDFGTFSVILSFMLAATGLYESVVFRPYSVYGGKATGRKGYASFVLGLNLVISFFLFIAMMPVSLRYMPMYLYCLCWLAFLIMMMYWAMRRSCYIYKDYSIALTASFLMLLVTVPFMLYQHINKCHDLGNAFSVILLSNAIAFSYIYFKTVGVPVIYPRRRLKVLISRHLRFGRWMAATTVVFTASTTAFVPLVAFFRGPVEAGFLRILQTLSMPVNQVNTALSLAYLPQMGSQCRNERINTYKRIFPFFVYLPLIYILIFAAVSPLVFNFLGYSGTGHFFRFIVVIFGVSVVSEAGYQVISLLINSMKKSKPLFIARSASIVCLILIGLPLIITFHYGYVLAYSASSAVSVATLYYFKKAVINDTQN
jgi:O-antigen/teichoic acid export membrane protein